MGRRAAATAATEASAQPASTSPGSQRARPGSQPAPASARPSLRPDTSRAIPSATALVDRPRLVNQILGVQHDDPVARDLVTEPADVTVVTGPAGAGKTVLLQQTRDAARALGRHALCVSLRTADDSVRLMWEVLAKATVDAVVDDDPGVAARLTAGVVDAAATGRVAAIRRAYIDALAGLSRPLHLLLDDTDTLLSGSGADQLTWLVRHQPETVRLVLAGRHLPGVSIARLRVEGRLLEVREFDLRFNQDEAAALLDLSDVTLTQTDLTALVDRCEGWAAALRLAAIELLHCDDPTDFVNHFSGAEPSIGEFIEDEVLNALSTDDRAFLTQLATASSLTSELAVELTGRSDAGAVLARLSRSNTLVHRVRHTPPTYRYHGLLRSYLRSALAMHDAAESASLDRRIAHWWADRDDAVPALHHAVSAGAWELAGDLITTHGPDLILAGEHDALLAAFDAAPTWMAADESVGTWAIAAAARCGDTATLRRFLDRSWRDDLAATDARRRLLLTVAMLQEVQLTGHLGKERRASLPTMVDESSDSAAMMALIHAARGCTHTWLGDRAEAIADLRQAWGLTDRSRHASTRVDIAAHLCLNAIAKGDARQVRMWVEEVAPADDADALPTPWSPWLYDMAAWSAWLRMDRAAAREYIDLASLAQRPPQDHSVLNAAVIAAAIDYDVMPDRRRDAVQAIRAAHRETPVTTIAPADTMLNLVSVEVPLALGIGEIGWAEQALDRLSGADRDTADARVLEAQIQLAAGKAPAARALLSSIVDESLSCRLQTLEATAWALIAHLARVAGEPARAHDFLMRALELADYADTPRVLTFTPIQDLLIWEHGRLGHLEGLAERIGAGRNDLLGGPANEVGGSLTARELEVLRDLPSLMPLDQIAKLHVVSTNTVKTHVKSIYRKLGVNGRRAAVDRARSLGLI